MQKPIKCYCGEMLARTPSGYCCPKGHGKLHLASIDEIDPAIIDEVDDLPVVQSLRSHFEDVVIALGDTLRHFGPQMQPADIEAVVDALEQQADALKGCKAAIDGVVHELARHIADRERTEG